MNSRVKITEADLTKTLREATNEVDVVYVPGFGSAAEGFIAPFVPTLCKSVSEFKLRFGDEPQTFAEKQYYPIASSTVDGFPEIAIPAPGQGETETVWFEQGAADLAYIYACELLSLGIPVMYERINGGVVDDKTLEVSIKDFYLALNKKIFAPDGNIANKDYEVKYLTAGGYPVFEYGVVNGNVSNNGLVRAMANIAANRGECIALPDHTNNSARPLIGDNSVFNKFQDVFSAGAQNNADTYCTMFTPWANILMNENVSVYDMPASFSYLACLANSLQNNPAWLAISGVGRGLLSRIRYLCTDQKLTNAIADSYQVDEGSSLNAITYINGYGYCIWGNRTARFADTSKTTGFATKFLNVRNLLCDVKKQLYLASQSLLFEPNTSTTWINFVSLVTPLLDKMVTGSGLKDYKIIQESVDDERTKISATVKLYPVYSVEEFEIAVEISDSDVTVQ